MHVYCILMCVCVCVSHSVPRSFALFDAGGCPTPEERASNKEALQVVLISGKDAFQTFLRSTFDQAVPLSVCLHGG